MKKLRIFVSIALAFIWFTAWSAPRNLEQARQTARNFYVQNSKTKAPLSDEDFVLVYPRAVKSGSAQAPLYVFNLNEEKGFVMVNGEDDLRPVLGYSLSGGFPTDVLPANLQYWLDTYRQQIEAYQEAVKNGTMPGYMAFSNAYPKTDAPAVGPLLENYAEGAINYNQSAPYNLLCPDPDETGSPAVTGCVATALAQIARYHKHPAKGTGHISYTAAKLKIDIEHDFTDRYDWQNMRCDYNDYNYNPSQYTEAEKNAIATLMRDIGYASRMDYGYDESGAVSLYALAGMQQYMGYSKAADILYRDYFTDRQWMALLISEIDAGRPLYYSGRDDETNAGHAFVCDGYQADDYFHFNWGWGTWGNGWYWINNLVPSQTGTGAGNGQYNAGQGVFVNFKPDGGEVPAGGNLYYQDNGQAPDRKSLACRTGFYEKDSALSCTAYDFWNLSSRTLTIDIGVVYWGHDGSFVKAVVAQDMQSVELESYYGWNEAVLTINPGKDVPAGTYRISLGSRCAGSAQWEEVKAQRGYTYAYTVTVREDGYDVKEVRQVAKPDIDQPEGMFPDSIEVAITCATPGASILYSLDGSAPSLPYTRPIVLKESATLKAIAVKNGMDPSDEARAVYTCARETLKSYTSVANLRELRENGEANTYYRITGRVTVTFAAANYAILHVEDSTGGMMISDLPGLYRTQYRIGDVLEHLCGRFQRADDGTEPQLETIADENIPVFKPVAQTVPHAKKTSMAQIKQNAETYAGTLVEIENVRLVDWGENAAWSFDSIYRARQDEEPFYIYAFYSAGEPYFDKSIPSTFTLRGIVRFGNYIFPRIQSDIRGEGAPLPETYTLTVNASPGEGGTVSGGGTYESGMKITLHAKAADEWKFVRWSDDSTQAIRTVTVTEDATYTAYFKRANEPETYTLTVNASPSEGGKVNGGGTYGSGEEARLKATANAGWKFTRWNDNNKQATRTVTVTEDASYTAYFEKANVPETYTLTVNASPSEGGTVSGGGTYESREEASLKAKANDGWKFTRWNDGNTQATRTVTVSKDATYTAYFERVTDRETESLSQIKIYPNPSEGVFIVETGLPLKAEIYDNLGLSRGAYRWKAGKHTVDLRPCAPGIYYLRLTSAAFTQTVKLVVK